MASEPPKPKIPINVRKPHESGQLMEFLQKFHKADENELFGYIMGDSHLLALVLANPVVFDTFRKLLGKSEETKYNRDLLDIAIEDNSETRYEKVRNILCKLTEAQMTVLHNVIVDTFNYYRALKNRGTVCDDKNAAKVYRVLIYGIPNYPGSSEAAELARMGMMGQWRILHNEVVGQILVGLGEIEEKELLLFLKQREANHAARSEIHGCPLCHGIYPEEKMVKVKLKPYGDEAWVCLTDYNRELEKGDQSKVYGEPIPGTPPQPVVSPEQQLEEYGETETAGKLWKKPVISPETQADFIEKFPPPPSRVPLPVMTAVTSNNIIIESALGEIHAIMKEKKCSMQKAFEIWKQGQKSSKGTPEMIKGIRRTGVREESGTPSEGLLTPEEIQTPPPSRLLTPEEIQTPPPSRLLTPEEIQTPPPSRLLTPEEIQTPPGTLGSWAIRIKDAQDMEALGNLYDDFIDQHTLDEQQVDQVETLFEDRRRSFFPKESKESSVKTGDQFAYHGTWYRITEISGTSVTTIEDPDLNPHPNMRNFTYWGLSQLEDLIKESPGR